MASSCIVHDPMAAKRLPTGIYDLPVELLTIVFRFASTDEGEEETGKILFDYSPYHKDNYICDYGPTNFPYNLAPVCPLWHATLALVPEYWTEIVIILNSVDPTPLSEVKAMFERTKDLAIIVRVTRTDNRDADLDEGTRASAVIDAMKPHVSRCLSIVFQLIHGSSLPFLSRDLANVTNSLQQLVLTCQFDDGLPLPELRPSAEEEAWKLKKAVALSELRLQGHTVRDLFSTNRQVIDNSSRKLNYLELGKFNAHNYLKNTGSDILPRLLEGVAAPRNLMSCILSDIHFLPLPLAEPKRHSLTAGTFEIRNLDDECVNVLIASLQFRTRDILKIEACSISEISLTKPAYLSLKNIDSFLLPCLSKWNGRSLRVENCPGLTDLVLNTLIRNNKSHPRELRKMVLVDCHNFSVVGLRRLVTELSFDEVLVVGHGYRMSEEEQSEFKYIVQRQGECEDRSFSWDERDVLRQNEEDE